MAFTTIVKAQEVQRALDSALESTSYCCKLVSWDDACRSQDPFLHSFGPNITDTYLRAANGASLYTVRSDNWNEKLGVVSARDITLLSGNCDGLKDGSLSTIRLDKFLANPYENGSRYVGLTGDLHNPTLDAKVSIRFQTVFLPLEDDGKGMQFASEAYNYQTSSDDDPRNILLLATTQGLSVHAGARGRKRLLLHHGEPGNAKAYWMKAEASRHKVGAEQKDTPQERADALARGNATSERFGIRGMGERFNALMTIQVPLRQWNVFGCQPKSLFGQSAPAIGASPGIFGSPAGFGASPSSGFGATFGTAATTFGSKSSPQSAGATNLFGSVNCSPASSITFGQSASPSVGLGATASPASPFVTGATAFGAQSSPQSAGSAGVFGSGGTGGFVFRPTGAISVSSPFGQPTPTPQNIGTASAARLSRGDYDGMVSSLALKRAAVRHSEEHITVTVVLYHAVKDGVPSPDDARAAVEELERLYSTCNSSGNLVEDKFNALKFGPGAVPRKTGAPLFTNGFCFQPPKSSNDNAATVDLVMKKMGEFENAQNEKFLEMKLMALGAIEDALVRGMISAKLDAIKTQIEKENSDKQAMIAELKLLVKGALNN